MKHTSALPMNLTRSQQAVLWRLVAVYGVVLLTFFVIRSDWLSALMQHSFVGPKGFNYFPLVLIGLLLLLFFLTFRAQWKPALLRDRRPWWQLVIAVLLLCGSLYLAYSATHPSVARFYAMHLFLQDHPRTGAATVAAFLYSAMISPLLPAFLLFFPFAICRKFCLQICFGVLLIEGYLFSNVLEALYHATTAGYTLGMTEAMLHLLPGSSVSVPDGFRLSYQGYSVVVGPVCSGLTMLSLFAGFFLYLWIRFAKRIMPLYALIAFTCGILLMFFLNTVRIFLIMVMGANFPGLATDLFHSSVGAVLFFIIFVFYLKWTFPWLIRHSR